MLKRVIVIILTLVSICQTSIYAQVRSANKEEIKKFLKSKTMVVIDENEFSAFNAAMKIAMENTWKITNYQFITNNEFETKRKSDKYSFILLSEVALNEGMMIDSYNILNFVLGCAKESLNQMPDLGSIPLSYKGADEGNYLYKLEGFLNFMQYFVQESYKGNIDMQNLYGLCTPDLKTKEIWITQDELSSDISSIEQITPYYKWPVKIKTKEEIQIAIEQKKKEVAYTHTIAPPNPEDVFAANCWKFIIAADKGNILYSGGHMIDKAMPGTFIKDDFDEMNKCQ